MGLKGLSFSFLFLVSGIIFSQNNTKSHYEIIADANTDVSLYKKILDIQRFDSLRFVHERRTIEFINAPIKIVLYSADELLANYGKQINKANIIKPFTARKVKIKFTESNQIQIVAVD